MPPRVFAAGTILATAGLLSAHAVAPQETGSVVLGLPSLDAALALPPRSSLDLASLLAPGRTTLLSLAASDLPVGQAWSALEADTASLSVLRVTQEENAALLITIGNAEHTIVVEDAVLDLSIDPAGAAGNFRVSINGQLIGTITGAPTLTLHGLQTGIVYVNTAPTRSSRSDLSDSAGPSPSASAREAVLAEFDRLKTTKQGKWVLKDETPVPFETILDEKRGVLAALMSTRTHCVFLDWELGDDANDGLSADTTGRSGRGPKKTWQAAMSVAPIGGVIVAMGGVYSYDETQPTQPKDLTLVSLGSIILCRNSRHGDMLASGLFQQGPAGLEITSKYLNISAE